MPNKKQSRSSGSSSRKSSSSSGARGGNRRGQSPVLDDLTYNVITVLHEKSKGLEAYDQYLQDARQNEEIAEIFEELREQDQQAVQRLGEALRNLIGGGELSEDEEAA